MKLLVLSDTQIGSGRNLAVDRLADQEAVLDQIVALANEEDVDLVVHAGDVHDSRTPSEEARLVFRNFARRISDGRRFVIVAGNHDLRGTAGASPVDQHDDRYTFEREPNVLRFAGLTLGCLPWVPSSHYKAKLPQQLPHAELNDRIAELLVDVAGDLRDSCEDGFKMMVGHWPVSGGVLPTGLPVEQIPGPVLPLSAIEDLGFDLAAFGDIHHPAMIGRNVLSLGGTQVDNWGDEGVDHGVWLIDTEPVTHNGQSDASGFATSNEVAKSEVRFVPLTDRRFQTVDVDLVEYDGRDHDPQGTSPPETRDAPHEARDAEPQEAERRDTADGCLGNGDDQLVEVAERATVLGGAPRSRSRPALVDETDRIAAAIAEHFPLTDATVRLRVKATADQIRRVDFAAIRRLADDAGVHRLVLAPPEIERVERARVEGVTETLSVPEALDLYIEHNEVGTHAEALKVLNGELLEEMQA